MADQPNEQPLVRINVLLSSAERDAFDYWCRFGGRRTSMNWRIRELIRADAAGKIDLPRTPPPQRGGTRKAVEPPSKPPRASRTAHSPTPKGRRGDDAGKGR